MGLGLGLGLGLGWNWGWHGVQHSGRRWRGGSEEGRTNSILISPESIWPDEYAARTRSNSSSSCWKKVSHWYGMSWSQSPPSFRCSSAVSRPPEKAYVITFFLMIAGLSVTKMAEESRDALIFEFGPWSAGKNLECSSAGFRKPSLWATSRVIRKYGSWSIAHGMRQGIVVSSPKIWGKLVGKEGAACTAGKACLPMFAESSKPKIPLTWLYVTAFCIFTMLGYILPM
mmetsp:Transcript_56810/g.126862  ORF Transcript_56810/g.126862 Transcript_56810/m.126862 type:complete len:228 (+) Transcript_56810:584-1267(+)